MSLRGRMFLGSSARSRMRCRAMRGMRVARYRERGGCAGAREAGLRERDAT